MWFFHFNRGRNAPARNKQNPKIPTQKSSEKSMKLKLSILTAAAAMLAGSAYAQTTLQVSSSTSNYTVPTGGSLTWDAGTTNWWNGTSSVVWTSGSIASLTNTLATTLNLAIDQTAGGILQNTANNYTIGNISGATRTLNISGNVSAVVNRQLTLSGSSAANVVNLSGTFNKTPV